MVKHIIRSHADCLCIIYQNRIKIRQLHLSVGNDYRRILYLGSNLRIFYQFIEYRSNKHNSVRLLL